MADVHEHDAATTEFDGPLVKSRLTATLVAGQSFIDVSCTVFDKLGWSEVGPLNPVFEGDTSRARPTVLATRASKSRLSIGVVPVAIRLKQLRPEASVIFIEQSSDLGAASFLAR